MFWRQSVPAGRSLSQLVFRRRSCFQCESAACSNDVSDCVSWAAAGECATNERFMVTACPHACRICFVNQTAACRRPDEAVAAAGPGTLEANFQRLASGPPASHLKGRVLSREPWVRLRGQSGSAVAAQPVLPPAAPEAGPLMQRLAQGSRNVSSRFTVA